MTRMLLSLLAGVLLAGTALTVAQETSATVYVAYYWRAKAGKIADYNAYIREYAEPIDEAAREAGAFEEVRTYLAAPGAEGTTPEWTHLRVFKLKDAAAADALSAALDAATKRLRDDAQRKAAAERAATLRDFVRQERWGELR